MKLIQNNNKLYKWTDTAFLCSLGLYLLFLTAKKTTFLLDLKWEKWDWMFFLILFLGVVRLFLLSRLPNSNKKHLLYIVLASLPAGIVWMLVYKNDQYEFLRYLAILTVCCIGCDYRKILKIYTVVVGLTVSSAVFCALGGAIRNLVYLDNANIRSAWGISYTTDFASFLVFLCLISWVAWPEISDFLFLIPGLTGILISWYFCRSTTSVLCLFLFCVFILLHFFMRKTRFIKFVSFLSAFSFPCLCALMLGLLFAYRKGFSFALRINRLLHRRLFLASSAYDQYGVTLFGTPFEQSGSGRSTLANTNYQFVDSSYLLILLRYGCVILAILCVLWVILALSAKKSNDFRLCLSLIIIAFHAVSEHHFTDLNYNIFIILPFCMCYLAKMKDFSAQGETNISFKKQDHAFLFFFCSAFLFILIPLRLLLSWFRSLCTILDMGSGVYHQRALFIAVLAGFIFIIYFLSQLYDEFICFFQKKKLAPKRITFICSSLGFIVIFLIGVYVFLSHFKDRYHDTVEADLNTLAPILSSKDISLHVDDIPAFYPSYIDNDLLNGEDLVRFADIVLVTDAHSDYTTLIRRGFLYAPISESHAIYTNSPKAIESLKETGCHFTGYFPAIEEIDMESVTRKNKLQTNADGNGILTSFDTPIEKGPSYSLSASNYTITYTFHSIDSDSTLSDGDSIAAAKVFCQQDESILKEQALLYNSDNSAPLTYNLNLSVPDTNGIVFQLYPAENITLTLDKISFQETPPYDRHDTYDHSGQIIYSTFFTLDGTPCQNPEYNSWARAYEYDQNGNNIKDSCLDLDGNLMIGKQGFAVRRFEYNHQNQVIHISYYDASDHPVLLEDGYASCDYGYDQNGNCVYKRYYDADCNPTKNIWGYTELHHTYNSQKQLIREEYYDENSLPCLTASGYFAITRGYDSSGNNNSIHYFDVNGNPCLLKNSYSSVEKTFDDKHRLLTEQFYGTDQKPVLRPEGFTRIEYTYEKNKVSKKYFDLEGNLVTI